MQLLRDVLENYLQTRAQLNGKAINAGAIDQKRILIDIPEFFVSLLDKQGRAGQFKVDGSIGNGNMARVPWVGIFNRTVTESAQNGYYIVLLFSEDMKSCVLSLNQGVTAFENQYSRKIALAKMKGAAVRSLRYFKPDSLAVAGPIDLRATGDLGQGYEQGAIESFRYDLDTLPPATVVAEDFQLLLSHYDQLIPVAGTSLQTLVPINEAEFQHVVLEKAAFGVSGSEENHELSSGGAPVPAKYISGKTEYQRDAKVSALALMNAQFKCEIDPTHKTFISSAKKVQYVEAHHLVPMSQQGTFSVSLDVSANVVALCTTCHKLLHHGRAADKRAHLMKLLADRQDRLKAREIMLEEKDLLALYSKDLLEDE